ncbi:glycosyltransferase family protein [Chryseobacterium proteolyticum]|uniref:glycosyltransferase family protein n=1 Tax=Chryseobacterium proteolyticum TaxID=118127 RepID=UPI003983C5C8
MKICVISYDFWGYDKHIVDTLCKKGIDAHHIKIGNVTHSNFQERATNAISKVFLNKNLKTEKRQQFVIDSLAALGPQDQILVLNPDTFDISTLQEIKAYSKRLITYLYDSLERLPVEIEKLKLFDKIFSFDIIDVKKHAFEKLTNYIYLDHHSSEEQNPEMDLFYITSYDNKRVSFIKLLTKKLIALNLKFQIMIIGKKSWKNQLKNLFITVPESLSIIFSIKKISHQDLPGYYKNSKALLDLTRENQHGLSFRVFEAMALEKKIITDNIAIKDYDFYNPNNILVLDETCSNLNTQFFEQPYEKIPDNIYYFYTIDSWVDRVFKLA